MARYFKAPVLQPVDYGFKMPVEKIYGVMQQEQQKHSKTLEELQNLYDVGKLDAVDIDYDNRNNLIQERYDEVEAALYDENGNIKDLRSAGPIVQKIARRRAKQEQAGGEWHSIQKNYDDKIEYDKRIDELLDKGEITAERSQLLKARSYQDYVMKGGVAGQRGINGAYATYNGIDPVKNLDRQKVSDAYGKDVAMQRLQAAQIILKDGSLNTQATINASAENLYQSMGEFVQSGTMEFRTLETIMGITYKEMASDHRLIEDLTQEALLMNPEATEEDITKYIDGQLMKHSQTTAEKYAQTLFSPKIMQDWKKKLDYRHALKLKEIDYEKRKESTVIIGTGKGAKTQIKSPTEMRAKIKDRSGLIRAKRDAIKASYPDPSKLSKLEKEQYDAEVQELAAMERDQASDKKIIYSAYEGVLSQEKNKTQAINAVSKSLAGMLLKTSYPSDEAVKVTGEYINEYVTELAAKEGTTYGQALAQVILDEGGIAAMTTSKNLEEYMKVKGLDMDEEMSSFQFNSKESKDAYRAVTRGESVLDPVNGKYLERAQNSALTILDPLLEGAEVDVQINPEIIAADKGDFKSGEKMITQLFLQGQVQAKFAGNTSQAFNIDTWMEEVGVESYSDVRFNFSKTTHHNNGEIVIQVSAKGKGKKGKSSMQSTYIIVERGNTAFNQINDTYFEYGARQIEDATANTTSPGFNKDFSNGAIIAGSSELRKTDFYYRMSNLKQGQTTAITAYGGTDVDYHIRKVKGGYVIAEGDVIPKGSPKAGTDQVVGNDMLIKNPGQYVPNAGPGEPSVTPSGVMIDPNYKPGGHVDNTPKGFNGDISKLPTGNLLKATSQLVLNPGKKEAAVIFKDIQAIELEIGYRAYLKRKNQYQIR